MNIKAHPSISVFDLGDEPDDFNPDYLQNERVRDKRRRTWRAEVYERLEDNDGFYDIMDYHGYDVFSTASYAQNRIRNLDGFGGVLSFRCQTSEAESSNVVFVKDFVIPKGESWTEDGLYAYVVASVVYREPFFSYLSCDQSPPSPVASERLQEHIDSMYNPSH